MPKIECWDNLPEGVRQHLIDRMRDRAISIADLNQLRAWIESQPGGDNSTIVDIRSDTKLLSNSIHEELTSQPEL